MVRCDMASCQHLVLCLLLVSAIAVIHVSSTASNDGHATQGKQSSETANHLTGNHTSNASDHQDIYVHVAHLNFEAVKSPFLICLVVLIAALSKIGFHHANFLSSKVPESCLLIVLGVVLGAIVFFSDLGSQLPHFFGPHQFFHYLLPPIILEASYSLHDRVFFNNLGSILLYAVVGTVLACFTIGYTLYGLAMAGAMGDIQVTAVEILLFSSLIVAVDPVAVLAVFQEVGVNNVLYFLVFGESLLNDAVTIVLYNVMKTFNQMDSLEVGQIVLGFVAFLVVALGGLSIGIVVGCLSALVTKHTENVKVVEPIAVYGFAYLAFLLAEMFELSGIISIIGCGLTQVQYTFRNMTDKSLTTVKYFTKVISTTNEIVIFLFLGLSLVSTNHHWHTGLTLWTLFLCLLYRFMITYALTFLVNRFDYYRVRKIGLDEQFIMSYGGLRGAVCFSLVALLDPVQVPQKNMFVTTALAVIIFTVFIQGITIKPLVHYLSIKLASTDKPTLYEELTCQANDKASEEEKCAKKSVSGNVRGSFRVKTTDRCCMTNSDFQDSLCDVDWMETAYMHEITDHLMAGVEDIVGIHGKFYLKELLEYYDSRYLGKWLLVTNTCSDSDIMKLYEKLALQDHYRNLYLCGAPQKNLSAEEAAEQLEVVLDIERSPLFKKRINEQDDDDDEDEVVRRHKHRPPALVITSDHMTYRDLRKMLVKNPSEAFLHRKYDKDLISPERSSDIGHFLHAKQQRTRRLERVLSMAPGFTRGLSWSRGDKSDRKSESTKDITKPDLSKSARYKKAQTVDMGGILADANGTFNENVADTSSQPLLLKDDDENEASNSESAGRAQPRERPQLRFAKMIGDSEKQEHSLHRQDATETIPLEILQRHKSASSQKH